MADPADESKHEPLRLDFNRRLKLEFHGSRITTNAGLLANLTLADVYFGRDRAIIERRRKIKKTFIRIMTLGASAPSCITSTKVS